MSHVFISYSSQDRPFVDDLVNRLKAKLVDVWYDQIELRVGDSIVAKINQGLRDSDWLILVLSQASMKSKWVAEELTAAIALTVQKGAFVLPLLKEPVDIPPLLAGRKYADFTRDETQGLQELLKVVAPETQLFADEASQRSWHILSTIARGTLDQQASSSNRAAFAGLFAGCKQKWNMTDEVFDVYVDCCFAQDRLLALQEFIRLLPTVFGEQSEARRQALKAFLFKKAIE